MNPLGGSSLGLFLGYRFCFTSAEIEQTCAVSAKNEIENKTPETVRKQRKRNAILLRNE
jgi:hypothetical protein